MQHSTSTIKPLLIATALPASMMDRAASFHFGGGGLDVHSDTDDKTESLNDWLGRQSRDEPDVSDLDRVFEQVYKSVASMQIWRQAQQQQSQQETAQPRQSQPQVPGDLLLAYNPPSAVPPTAGGAAADRAP